jgi:hypothetical protein
MTKIPFTPSASAIPPFSSLVTLDGKSYLLTSVWNLAGQRWYINLTDSNGNIILNRPLTGSPMSFSLNMVFGLFVTSTLVYRTDTGNFEVGP